MKRSVAVLGLGLFGRSVAKSLALQGSHVIAIDINMDNVEEVMDSVEQSVQADFTKLDQLKQAGVSGCDVGIVATGEKLEVSILGVMNLRELGVSEVIVKTKKIEYAEVLMKVGATRVVLPEIEVGEKLASELSNPHVLDVFQLDDKYEILELKAMNPWVGKTIRDLDIRTRYGINIIALKAEYANSYTIRIEPSHIISAQDVFVVLAEKNDFEDL